MEVSPLTPNVLLLCRACVILGVIFLLSSVCIVVKAIHDLSTKLLPEVVSFFFFLSVFPEGTSLLYYLAPQIYWGKLGRWKENKQYLRSPEDLILECE